MIRGRHASLEALQQAAMGQDTGVMVWLEQHGLASAPRLAEKLQVESGWELAVETVLGDSLQALCVDDLDPVAGCWVPWSRAQRFCWRLLPIRFLKVTEGAAQSGEQSAVR